MQRKYTLLTLLISVAMVLISCQQEEYTLPETGTQLQNDCIKRTLGPNVVGLDIEFVYAMALGFEEGVITSAKVEASIPGASGTYLDNHSYYTGPGGSDIGVEVASPSTTTDAVTEVTFTKDTCAASLRYFYKIPEEARGKTVSFTFSAEASTGEKVSLKRGPYKIAEMDMKLDLVLSDDDLNYFSIADMKAFNKTEASNNAEKIDLVYLYRPINGINFNHALVAPSANNDFLPGISLPSGVNRSTKIFKTWALRDRHLARMHNGIYIDDLDFIELNISDAPDYAINMKAEAGAWLETEDGKYRAYIFINSINDSARTMKISIKRYQMK